MLEDSDYTDSDSDYTDSADSFRGAPSPSASFDDSSFGEDDFGHMAYDDDATYACAFCGENNGIDLDITGGPSQSYVEDCQVCCRPNMLSIQFDEEGRAEVWAEPEG